MPPIQLEFKPLNFSQPTINVQHPHRKKSKRDTLRAEARYQLTSQYRTLTSRDRSAIPWSNIWKAVDSHRLVLFGYPTHVIQDPIHLRMPQLRRLVDGIHEGTCGFRKISEEEFRDLACRRQKAIEAGYVKPHPSRKKRSDAGDVRGCHLNPETRTQTKWRGKVICSPAWVEEDEIEDFSEWETEELDLDPIENWE